MYDRLSLPKYAILVPYIIRQYQIPQKCRNSTEMGKFRGSSQNSAFRGKLIPSCFVGSCFGCQYTDKVDLLLGWTSDLYTCHSVHLQSLEKYKDTNIN